MISLWPWSTLCDVQLVRASRSCSKSLWFTLPVLPQECSAQSTGDAPALTACPSCLKCPGGSPKQVLLTPAIPYISQTQKASWDFTYPCSSHIPWAAGTLEQIRPFTTLWFYIGYSFVTYIQTIGLHLAKCFSLFKIYVKCEFLLNSSPYLSGYKYLKFQ